MLLKIEGYFSYLPILKPYPISFSFPFFTTESHKQKVDCVWVTPLIPDRIVSLDILDMTLCAATSILWEWRIHYKQIRTTSTFIFCMSEAMLYLTKACLQWCDSSLCVCIRLRKMLPGASYLIWETLIKKVMHLIKVYWVVKKFGISKSFRQSNTKGYITY